ncbi:MAG: ABC transporter ATP-binding protein [Ardenticatenia bacterium]|nr:ABC transporter ATP-binding protein [Ardenticatenia bacterium]
MENAAVVRLERVSRHFRAGQEIVRALDDVSMTVAPGEFVAIVGPSGSGKSTLLSLIAGLDRPTSGQVWVAGQRIDRLDEDALARWRRRGVGIVFQFFQLLPTLTALENVMLPLALAGHPDPRARATALLERLEVGNRLHHLPAELSGGEQQRVAIARAVANRPPLLLADEPTGNLDARTGHTIMAILEDLHRQGQTILLVTHDTRLAARADRRLELRDGCLRPPELTPTS